MPVSRLIRRLALLGAAALLALPALAQSLSLAADQDHRRLRRRRHADSIARLYGQKMSEVLNTPVIIDNKPGANQITAIRALMISPPDGYTLYAATGSSLVQNPRCAKACPMTR
jgi:tripartite-type tricarboxylate transporter receptor subunit TctC